MLIYSMSVSVDGFITDREGAFGWSAPMKEGWVSSAVGAGVAAHGRSRTLIASRWSIAR